MSTPFDIPTEGLAEVDYRPTQPSVGWVNIDQTRPADASLAGEAAIPPTNRLGETYRPQSPPRAPDRYIIAGEWAPNPYGDLQGPEPYPA